MEVSKFKNLRKSGLHSFKLRSDDELVSVALALPNPNVDVKDIVKLQENKKGDNRAISYDMSSLYEVESPGSWPTDTDDKTIFKKENGSSFHQTRSKRNERRKRF